MLDPIFDRLHVAEHHGRARFQTELVRRLHHFEPGVGIAFERRDSFPHPIDQDFAAAARDRPQPGLFELRNHFAQAACRKAAAKCCSSGGLNP